MGSGIVIDNSVKNGGGMPVMFAQLVAPTNPTAYSIWLNLTDSTLNYWDGDAWQPLAGGGALPILVSANLMGQNINQTLFTYPVLSDGLYQVNGNINLTTGYGLKCHISFTDFNGAGQIIGLTGTYGNVPAILNIIGTRNVAYYGMSIAAKAGTDISVMVDSIGIGTTYDVLMTLIKVS